MRGRSWRRRNQRPGAGRPSEQEVLASWQAADTLLDDGVLTQAGDRFHRACDSLVELAAGAGDKPVSYRAAAEYAVAQGGAAPLISPQDPAGARAAAESCLVLADTSPVPALRLGLTAHVAFALLSNAQTLEMRYQMADYGPPWARAVIACSRVLHDPLGYRELALYFARWAANVTGHLVPFKSAVDGVREVIRESLRQAQRLEAEVGDPAAAAKIEEILRRDRS